MSDATLVKGAQQVAWWQIQQVPVCHLFSNLAHPIAGLKLTKHLFYSILTVQQPPR
jgi:hypothetical protein